MLDYCKRKWAENEGLLREAIAKSENHREWQYIDIVKMVVNYILNPGYQPIEFNYLWDADVIADIDDGCYQGSEIFLIHRKAYQPDPQDYLITYVWYGSCSGCDTLQSIQYVDIFDRDMPKTPNDEQVNDYMTLCRDIVTRMKQPFGWGCYSLEEAKVEEEEE